MPQPFDLIRIAELVKLAAETARNCSAAAAVNGEMAEIKEITHRITAAAEELEQAARKLDSDGL